MILLIDAGNTRIKWALTYSMSETGGIVWLRNGALPTAQADSLQQQLGDIRNVQQIWVCNVAGDVVAQHIGNLQVGSLKPTRFITARATQCGVRNGYADPLQLGSDRWAALIAAWHLVGGRCLVVNCGTATTVDTLSETGEFIGGLILPGMELMQCSLGSATTQLQSGQGHYAAFPRNTADAMFSAAIQASCGAIERQYALMGSVAPVLMSGGSATQLQNHLNLSLRVEDNLVLQGLLLIAREEGA